MIQHGKLVQLVSQEILEKAVSVKVGPYGIFNFCVKQNYAIKTYTET